MRPSPTRWKPFCNAMFRLLYVGPVKALRPLLPAQTVFGAVSKRRPPAAKPWLHAAEFAASERFVKEIALFGLLLSCVMVPETLARCEISPRIGPAKIENGWPVWK